MTESEISETKLTITQYNKVKTYKM